MRTITTKSKKILADTFTPVSIYLKIRDVFPKSILLESTDFHHVENCYSFICMNPMADFIVENEQITMKTETGIERKAVSPETDVSRELQNFIQSYTCSDSSNSMNGFFGYIGYDSVRYFETVKISDRPDHSSIPDIYYSLYKYIIAFNHLKDEIVLMENLLENEASGFDQVEQIIRNGKTSDYPFRIIGNESTNLSDNEFIKKLTKAKEHCLLGDVFQLVVSRRFQQSFHGDDFNVYRQLRSLNPSPYLFYFDYGNFRLFGSSPESQIEIKGKRAYINPIAGTYPRTGEDEKDKEMAMQLSKDPKENAEHVMLVDLARNDLSRNTSNVRVENFKEIHFYSHVIHIVSKVSGQLQSESNNIKLLADSFPAGTLTGAPKYKAMELIDELEPNARGFYGGCIGIINFNGDMNHAITIRTFLGKNNTLYYQAGAGVVSKSNEQNELQEVNHKLGALKQAIQKANSKYVEQNETNKIKNSDPADSRIHSMASMQN
jgi:anthranilate synthase component 1